MALCIEQQPKRALASCEVADISGGDGMEITYAVWAGEREQGAEIRIDQRHTLASGAVFRKRSTKLCGQAYSEILGEFGARRALNFK
jgi:hypothetical protein